MRIENFKIGIKDAKIQKMLFKNNRDVKKMNAIPQQMEVSLNREIPLKKTFFGYKLNSLTF